MSEALSTLNEISRRFDSTDMELLKEHPHFRFVVNSYELFTHHIFSRVQRQNPDKDVVKESDCIVVQTKESDEALHLFPLWKMIETRVDVEAHEEINEAIRKLETCECKHIYLLFPLNDNFKKHIPVRSPKLDAMGLEYTLKLVPYTLV